MLMPQLADSPRNNNLYSFVNHPLIDKPFKRRLLVCHNITLPSTLHTYGIQNVAMKETNRHNSFP